MTANPLEGLDLSQIDQWPDSVKKDFIAQIEAAKHKTFIWFCKKGRACDGQPHDQYDYPHARSDQWPPLGQEWLVWALLGGRGSGKTRSGAEWTRYMTKKVQYIGIMGPTLPHVRDTMVEGESGLIKVFERAGMAVTWEVSKRRLTLPNGAEIRAFTGEEPERLRGPQHGAFWLDEPAHIPLIEPAWDNMMLGLRLGKAPKVLCTTTPLPTKWVKDLIASEDTVTVRASTYANLSNLAPTFRKQVLSKYEGTRLGRQELYGEILDDIVGALWNWSMIEDHRALPGTEHGGWDRVVVSIDPAGTSSKKRDETGIIVVAKRGEEFFVLADRSGHYTPNGWASAAWAAFDEFEADMVVAEKNYGGEMVSSTLRNSRPDGPVRLVHSRRGKKLRAEPIVGLYEQERVHHVGQLETLEEQMTEWVPDMSDSPDRVDALVHGITDLSNSGGPATVSIPGEGQGYEDGNGHMSPHLQRVANGETDIYGRPLAGSDLNALFSDGGNDFLNYLTRQGR